MSREPKISIIVPVYNSARTLERCVESILSQSFRDFELILINDGSKDRTASLCDMYSRFDSRVVVFHKSNEGVSSARNVGLKNAKGEYIVFVDSDDSIHETFLERLVEFKTYDIVLCSFKTQPKGMMRSFPETECVTNPSIGECLENHIYTGFSMPWAKLYHQDIILDNNLFFDEGLHSGEDTLWVSKYLAHVKSVKLRTYCGYLYYSASGLSTSGISQEVMDDTVTKIVASYEELESTFCIDLFEWKLNVAMYFFHRYVVFLSTKPIGQIISKLRQNVVKKNIEPIFLDEEHVLKGIRLKVFNFLVRQRWFAPLALYVKFFKRYL